MKITLIIQQTFDIDANSMRQARRRLREGLFATEESLLAVIDERGHDITEEWCDLEEERGDELPSIMEEGVALSFICRGVNL